MEITRENEKQITVSGIMWDADTVEELDGVPTKINFSIPVSEYMELDKDELEEYVSDKISDISGFCHNGFEKYTVASSPRNNTKTKRGMYNAKCGNN